MAEEEIVQEEVVEEEVEETEPETDDDSSPEEEAEEENDPYAGLSEKDLKKRLGKAEKALVKNKKANKPTPPITTPGSNKSDEIPEWGQKILASDAKRQFGYEHDLAPETVDAVFQFTGGKTPTETDMENDAVKAIIKSLQAKKRVAENTPRGGSTPTYKGMTYNETVSSPESTTEDKEAAFKAIQKQHGII